MRALPILNPCHLSFDEMHGDDARRHCDTCDKDVHDLSARTEDDAKALLAANAGRKICIRYARDGRGQIRFRGMVAAAAMAAAAATAGCSAADAPAAPVAPPVVATHAPDAGPDVDERLEMLMGDYVEDQVDVTPSK